MWYSKRSIVVRRASAQGGLLMISGQSGSQIRASARQRQGLCAFERTLQEPANNIWAPHGSGSPAVGRCDGCSRLWQVESLALEVSDVV